MSGSTWETPQLDQALIYTLNDEPDAAIDSSTQPLPLAAALAILPAPRRMAVSRASELLREWQLRLHTSVS